MTRAGNPQVTRRILIDSARDIYAEKGYDGTSVALVARRSHLTTGALYANFAGKDDLLMTVLEEQAEQVMVILGDQLKAQTSLAARIEVLLDWYGHRFERDRIGGRLTFDLLRQSYDNPEVRERLATQYARGQKLATEALEHELDGLNLNLPLSTASIAGLAFALGDGVLVQQLVFNSNRILDDVRALLTKLGVLKPA